MIKVKVNNEYKDVVKIFCGGTLQKEIVKVWSREAQEYVYESSVEYTGSLPITISANGDALLDYRIYGTDGGVGEPTENLFDKSTVESGGYIKTSNGNFVANIEYKTSYYIAVNETYHTLSAAIKYSFGGWSVDVNFYDNNKNWIRGQHLIQSDVPANTRKVITFSISSGASYVRVSYHVSIYDDIMLVEGSAAPESYIPYGYKLPIMVFDGNTAQSVPVYIGENQLDSVEGVSDYVDKSSGKIVRMIGEYTFTGEELVTNCGEYGACWFYSIDMSPKAMSAYDTITMRCDHPMLTAIKNRGITRWARADVPDDVCGFREGYTQVVFRSTATFANAEECKAYMKAQYDNGTPVKVSYWLETPIEEDPPVPLPEIPTIDGTTVIDYDLTDKPSEMYIKYRR